MNDNKAKRTPEDALLHLLEIVRSNPEYNKPSSSIVAGIVVAQDDGTEILHGAVTYLGGLTSIDSEVIDTKRCKAIVEGIVKSKETTE